MSPQWREVGAALSQWIDVIDFSGGFVDLCVARLNVCEISTEIL